MTDTNTARRIWRGDKSVIEESSRAFERDPSTLVQHASALYSFRRDRAARKKLIELRKELALAAVRLRKAVGLNARECANRADVLSTILEWLSRSRELALAERRDAARAAMVACRKGLRTIEMHYGARAGSHAWCLLRLTEHALRLREGDVGRTLPLHLNLETIARRAEKITDPNQRSRVYRKLGVLYRRQGSLWYGVRFGVKACIVPKVPMAVRRKSLAALIGIET